LLHDYGWKVEGLAFLSGGKLGLVLDPKRAWAERHLREAPIEAMTASRQQLLRIPGIGPMGAEAILRARRLGRLTVLSHLRQLNIRAPNKLLLIFCWMVKDRLCRCTCSRDLPFREHCILGWFSLSFSLISGFQRIIFAEISGDPAG